MTSIAPPLEEGDCMGYMGNLYEYSPENAGATLEWAAPECPPDDSAIDNCKWHAKMIDLGPCP